MVDPDLKPAFRKALRLHEIGAKTPYEISFAGKGKSGGSFGFMQGDMAAKQPVVQRTFVAALTAADVPAATIQALVARLSVHQITSPLTAAETDLIDGALLASRALVDAMDEDILQKVYDGVDACIAAAGATRMITAKAQLYIGMWINMTGPPSLLLDWLRGDLTKLRRIVGLAPATVDGAAMENYLRATDYYTENPHNFPHLQECAAAGAALLPPAPNGALVA
jgi:hypothetical protein